MSDIVPSRPSETAAAPDGAVKDLSAAARAFIALQHVLPQHGVSRLIHAAARSQTPWFKNLLIQQFVRGFRPDLSDALVTDPLEFESFNAFFTRALRADARPLPEDPLALAMLIDLFSERGYHATVDLHRIEVPDTFEPASGKISCRVKKVFRLSIRFQGSEIRRG